jgi:hypothetical protein
MNLKASRSVAIIRLLFLVVVILVVLSGCKNQPPSAPVQNTAVSTPAPAASPLTDFERDLRFIRNGQFTYVYVFSRKDGKPLDKEDGASLRKNAPQMVDCVTTDNQKRAICGTNFNLEQGGMSELKKRFVVEDYSSK